MSAKRKTKSLTGAELQLLSCLKAYIAGGKAEIVIDLHDERSLAELFSLAYFQKLMPVVADTLIKGSEAENTQAANSFMRTARRQAVKQAYLAEEFISFYGELSRRGFRPAVLKGELCRRLYSEPELRLSSDEDLLISEAEFSGCTAAMLDMGFSYASAPKEGEAADESGVIALNGPTGLHIELHDRLFDGLPAFLGLKRYFLESASFTENTDGGAAMRSLVPQDELLYLISHAAKHFTGGGFGVRTAADIAAFTMRYYDELDLEALAAQLKLAGCYKFACAVYDIAVGYFGYDAERFPLPMLSEKTESFDMLVDCLGGGVYGTATKARAQSAKYTRGATDGVSNTSTALRTLFPSASELNKTYTYLNKCRLLLPAAWASRIIKYLRSGRKDGQSGARLGRERTALIRQYGPMIDNGTRSTLKK